MTTTSQLMLDRVGQGASDASAGIAISSQRSITVVEATNAMRELASFNEMVNGLKVFSGTYKSGNSSLLSTPSASMFCVFPDAAQQFPLGPNLALVGGTLNGGHFVSAWNPAQAELSGLFELRLNGVAITSRTMKGHQVLPYLFRLPTAIYQTCGGFIEQMCSALLRSNLTGFVISKEQRVALNKTVAGELKNAVADIANTPVGLDRYVMLSGAAVSARIQADDDAINVVQQSFPTLYNAIILHNGLGTAI